MNASPGSLERGLGALQDLKSRRAFLAFLDSVQSLLNGRIGGRFPSLWECKVLPQNFGTEVSGEEPIKAAKESQESTRASSKVPGKAKGLGLACALAA